MCFQLYPYKSHNHGQKHERDIAQNPLIFFCDFEKEQLFQELQLINQTIFVLIKSNN